MRILALSDLHGQLPHPDGWPPADVLVIAGDICPDFRGNIRAKEASQRMWWQMHFLPWFQALPYENKHLTWGNHDWLDFPGSTFAHVDELVEIEGKTIWFSPWSNRFMDWNWMLGAKDMQRAMEQIPDGTNVIVSHGPPFGYGDEAARGLGHLGSPELFTAMLRVRPDAIICGHIHGGHGEYAHRHEPILLNPEAPLMEQQALVKLTRIYNVSMVDESYDMVHRPTLIEV